jgi:4-hydroxy-tetrahydrodipicolinate synthase
LGFQGVFSVLPTPFNDDGSLDLESLKKVVDLYMSAGINGVTALGVTGEVARLNEPERKVVLETIVKQVNGRGAVIAGTSADGLHKCIEYSREALALGASGVMVSPPRMPKLNSEAIVSHFVKLAAAVDIPIVIQDYPPISGFTMEPSLLARIAREVPSARTIKLEDPPTPLKTTRILEQAKGMEVNILGGLGGVFLLEELLAGAAGVMTGFAYPEILVAVVRAFKAGDLEKASTSFYPFVSLMRFEFQEGVGMAIRKEVLRRRGAIKSSAIRAPGVAMDRSTAAALDRQLNWIKANGGEKWMA